MTAEPNPGTSAATRTAVVVDVKWSGAALGSGLIEFVCLAHLPNENGPTVTPQFGSWSYCPGSQADGHDWRQIEPATRERLERYILPKNLRRQRS
jgi:hypothetical protein